MDAVSFIDCLGTDFFAGVPDSLLRAFCDALMDRFGISSAHHIIAANEGNAVAIAAGYHLATGKVGCVYLQNSGEGNIVNPCASLLDPNVYGIPVLFVIGWRGEPGVHDEPQHMTQGAITLRILETLGIPYCVVGGETTVETVRSQMEVAREGFRWGKSFAFVVRKKALSLDHKTAYGNAFTLSREEALRLILAETGTEPIVCTTGKASREVFEIREAMGCGHGWDFLTVGSMGHAASVAMGIALHRPDTRVWCIDGDGAALMHLGGMAVIASCRPSNFIHVLINNAAHESVGGLPTVAGNIDFVRLAESLGYAGCVRVCDSAELSIALQSVRMQPGPRLLEVRCRLGARSDLGRPTTTPGENRKSFMSQVATH